MGFDDAFATDLGERLGSTVDVAAFGDSETVGNELAALRSFLAELDDVNLRSLDVVVTDGVDLTEATDEWGAALDLPGGSFFALAASTGQTLGTVLDDAESSYQVALADANTDTEGGQSNV